MLMPTGIKHRSSEKLTPFKNPTLQLLGPIWLRVYLSAPFSAFAWEDRTAAYSTLVL